MLRSPIDRLQFALSLIAAVAWFVLVASHRDAGPWVVVKALPIPLLAAIAARHRAHLLASALILHGVGDVLIELSFLAGMVAFLAGHILYLVLFLRHRSAPALASAWLRVAMLAALGVGVLATLARGLEGVMAAAVPIYAVSLLAMAATAQLSRRGQPWLSVGAWFFVASDLLLAFETFGGGTPLGNLPIWPTYWIAQALLTLAWLQGKDRSS
jgi:uncharacterized membrane protein YhhN